MVTFFICFLNFLFKVCFLDSKQKKKSSMQICHFYYTYYRMKYQKYLGTNKYSLEQKCEWYCVWVWGLFLATVACYLNCHNRVVLAHPFWALATFPVCCPVLDYGKNRTNMGTEWSSRIWKKYSVLNELYTFHIMIILCQGDFREQIEKFVRLLLCTTENCWRTDQAWVYFLSSQ